MKTAKLADTAVLILLGFFAYHLTFIAGERGLFAFDQSVIFDGAYRISCGQVPFKDFVLLHGFFAAVVQSLFFALRGVNYCAYVCGAASINVLAALLGVWIVRLIYPERKILSYASGLLTAVYFYPPFGTPWGKQTGFFFCMAALFFILHAALRDESDDPSRRTSDRWSPAAAFASGIMTLLSFLSYQGVGFLALGLMLFVIACARLLGNKQAWACLAGFCAGLAAGGTILAAWVFLASDPGNFWKYSIQLPMSLGRNRAEVEGWSRFFEALLMGFTSWTPSRPMLIPPPVKWLSLWIRTSFLLFYLISVLRLVRYIKTPEAGGRGAALAALVVIALIHFQYGFMYVNLNHPMNGLPFIGIIVALGFGLLPGGPGAAGPMAGVVRRSARIFAWAGSIVFLTALSASGVRFALQRTEHPSFRMFPAKFGERFPDEKLHCLRWGDPTVVTQILRNPSEVKTLAVAQEDFKVLLDRLRAGNKNFFVFPDFSILYGLTGKPSPQPLLWFHNGTIYMDPYDPALDQWVVDSLIRNQVKVVILEEESYHGTAERLADFPLVRAFIDKNFEFTESISIFNIYEQKGS